MRRLVMALMIGAVAAGCGSDDKDSSSASTQAQKTVSAQEWRTKVVALCEENRRTASEGVQELQKDARAKDLSETEFTARLLELSVATTRPVLAKLEALPPPEGSEKQAERFTELLGETMPLFESNARALREKDRKALARNNDRIMQVAGESRELARELRIEKCIPPNSG